MVVRVLEAAWSSERPLATMTADLPPSSSVTGTRISFAALIGAADRRAACEDEVVKGQDGDRRTDSRIADAG